VISRGQEAPTFSRQTVRQSFRAELSASGQARITPTLNKTRVDCGDPTGEAA
jgi:hypothetical protein